MIGIGITTHNRYDIFKKSYEEMRKRLPKGAKFVVVDDASDTPVPEATFRFNVNAGINHAKNKCFELLDDCDHIFLFDDDTYPIADNWWEPYINSPEPHLMYCFLNFIRRKLGDSLELYRDSQHVAYSHPRGCMLYVEKRVLGVVGGMDGSYKRWGFEHVDFSNRVFNCGLTSFRYGDVACSKGLFYSGDEHEAVASSVSYPERGKNLNASRTHFNASFGSTAYCPYKSDVKYENNIILAAYLTGKPDAQRGGHWQPDYAEIEPLISSVQKCGQKMVLFHDCFDDKKDTNVVQYVKVECALSPYYQRWLCYYRYLREHPEIEGVFCVDSTDVEMLKNPFSEMGDKLYVGDERATLNSPWMFNNHREVPFLIEFFRVNRAKTLLNCGLLGGYRRDVINFCHEIMRQYFDNKGVVGRFEMGIVNFIARSMYANRLVHGSPVNTVFKTYDKTNGEAWFRHK